MNLADAIRAASHGESPLHAVHPVPSILSANPDQEVQPMHTPENHPEPTHPAVNQGNVVRLELFLQPEQMQALFKAIMQGQHSVLTIREAAHYLRMSVNALQRLADEGEVPGVLIDNKWRFPKANLDDWLLLQSNGVDSEEAA
ncbi:MAG: helix-turn-helix domain-containing protein [Fimbriimonadaceae bacterium]|nr:helix-turn-helix domain-containing protein [Fimbriimonadaceae bacterium]